MIGQARLSIQGMYNYDSSIFDSFDVPEGMDKGTAINYIMSECNDLEIIYPNPETLKVAINMWTTAELPIWSRMWLDANREYNPLWNVDAKEVRTIERENNSKAKGDSTTTDRVMGYNVDTDFSDSSQVKGDTETSGEEKEKIVDTFERGGNIGVTMATQLLEADLDLLPRFNIYNYIVDSFKYRFCVEVY